MNEDSKHPVTGGAHQRMDSSGTTNRDWWPNQLRLDILQTGGTLNSVLLRKGLIDHVSIVIAPVLIGGENTSTLIDGESLHITEDLKHVKALKLIKCDVLNNSYIHLYYDVINVTETL